MTLGNKFLTYKTNLIGLRSACERHFVSVVDAISKGLPSVQVTGDGDSDDSVEVNDTGVWFCPVCYEECPADTDRCVNFGRGQYFGCDTMRPKLNKKK